MINKLTVQYRLRALLVEWCDLPIPSSRQSGAWSLIGDEPAWNHIAMLTLLTPALLVLAVVVLRYREFPSSAESDV